MTDQTLHAYLKQFSPQTVARPPQIVRRGALATTPVTWAEATPQIRATATDLARWSDDGGHGRDPDRWDNPPPALW